MAAFLPTGKGRLEVAGAITLKKTINRDSVELKHFIVKESVIVKFGGVPSEETAKVRRKLLSYVCEFCHDRGVRQVEIEVPDYMGVSLGPLLVEANFKLKASRVSDVTPRHLFLTYSKVLPLVFLGDPFDELAIAKWIVTRIYDFNLYSIGSERATLDLDKARVSFNGDYLHNSYGFRVAPSHETYLRVPEEHALKGVFIVADGMSSQEKLLTAVQAISETRWAARLFFALGCAEDVKETARKLGFTIFDTENVRSLAGVNSTVRRNRLIVSEVRGMILDIGEVYRSRIEKRATDFNFIIATGAGFALEEIQFINGEQRLFAIFKSKVRGEDSEVDQVWGFARIVSANKLTVDHIRSVPESERVWKDEELDYFLTELSVNYNEKGLVTVLKLEPVIRLSSVVPAASFLSEKVRAFWEFEQPAESGTFQLIGDEMTRDEVVEYRDSFPVEDQSPTCYIDADTLTKFFEIHSGDVARRTQTSAFQPPLPIHVRSEAGKVISELLETRLGRDNTPTDAYVRAVLGEIEKCLTEIADVQTSEENSTPEKRSFVSVLATRMVTMLKNIEAFRSDIVSYDTYLALAQQLVIKR